MTTLRRPTVRVAFFTLFCALAGSLLYARSARGQEDAADEPAPRERGNACLTLDQRGASEALVELRQLGAGALRPGGIKLEGLAALDESKLWEAVGGAPGTPPTIEEAAALLARLRETGLFARVEARLADEGLVLKLTEHPQLRRVELHGFRELLPDDALAALVRGPAPARPFRDLDDDDDGWGARKRRSKKARRQRRDCDEDCAPQRAQCAEPLVPPEWVAQLDGLSVRPGVLWLGLQAALERLARRLRDDGYLLATFTGSLAQDGTLVLYADEGRLEALDLRGVSPSLRDDVRRELGLAAGDTFSLPTLRAGMARVRHRWPFLHTDGTLRPRFDEARVVIEDAPWGGARFHTVLPEGLTEGRDDTRERRRDEGSRFGRDQVHLDFLEDEIDVMRFRSRRVSSLRALDVDGKRLVLHLRADHAEVSSDWVELVRHTQVTGFAPGLPLSLRFWDPGDRVHLTLDGFFQINSKRAGHAASGDFLQRIGASERVDWLAGAHLALPGLSIAELGGQLHTLTDTSDRFRIGRLDSYLYSFLLNRPESEYFRRSGATAFATVHAAERLTLGAEYRLDRYASLDALRVPVVFNGSEAAYANPAIDDGLMGSVVFRFEWSDDPIAGHKVGNLWRATDTSLLPRDFGEPGLRTLATVEVADPKLGGDFHFVKFVSDSALTLQTGHRDALTLRVRVAGGHAVPLQKQEALGGWTALRGYAFKEFRGDYSALGTLQWEGAHFGAFADLGSVKQAAGWTDPSLGVGALFHIDDVRLEAAWRTDQQAKVLPELRVLFARTF